MFEEIQTFDETVLEDELLKILEKSPHTQQHSEIRVQEIIVQIMSEPIIQQLKNENQKLREQVKDLGNFNIRSQSKKLKYEQKLLEHNNQLKKQLQSLKAKIAQLQNQKQVHRQKQIENQANIDKLLNLEQINQQLKEENQKINEEKSRLAIDITKIDDQNKMKGKQIKELNRKVQFLVEQNEKNKITMKQSRNQLSSRKKMLEKSEERIRNLEQNEIIITEKLKESEQKRQNQRKHLNNKLISMQTKNRHYQKQFMRIKNLKNLVEVLKEEMRQNHRKMSQMIEQMKKQTKNDYILIMDEIGEKMGEELRHLMKRIQKTSSEARIYKEQNRLKQETIKKMEKLYGQNQMMNSQLKKDLRGKKKEVDALRKNLAKDISENDAKLSSLQNNYHHVLRDVL